MQSAVGAREAWGGVRWVWGGERGAGVRSLLFRWVFSGCLSAFAAPKPRPALRAGDGSLALAVSLDPANALRRWDLALWV